MARRTPRRWRCFVVSSQQQRRAQGRCANEEEDDEDDEDHQQQQQQAGAIMLLSSTEEIVYRFLGFAQATRPRTCSPFHQVRAYVRSSCSSYFLPSPTSPPLTFLIDCSSSPSLLPSSFKQRKKKKNSPCLLACCQQKDPATPTYSPFHQVRVIFVHANFVSIYLLDAPPPPPLSSEKRKEKKRPCLLARCQ
jgi:hypothetical protein